MNDRMSQPTEPATLPAIGMLQSLNEDDRRSLAASGAFQNLSEGMFMLRQGDEQDHLFVLVQGKLSASCRSHAGDVELGMIMPGETIGEMNVLDPKKASADVRAVVNSRVWLISRAALDTYIEQHPLAGVQILRAIARDLCRRIRKTSDKILRQAEMTHLSYEWTD